MCAVHRRAVIAEIRERLASGQPCRVISTQLLEAGVDLDFPTGYRAMAGLESIIQAAGRVNREGRRSHANLIIFEPDSEYAKQVPTYIKQTAAVTDLILKKFEDPVCLEAIQDYFDQLYGISAKNAFDQSDILACFEKSGSMPAFDFAKAAERFKLIDNGTRPVIIPYDDTARTLLQELQTTFTPFQTIRKLQSYTVNIFQPEFQALENAGAILPYADTYAVLNQTYGRYDPHTGLTLASMEGGQAVFLDA
jgi:CRISPR-associated endonuclease/helicase Cas3